MATTKLSGWIRRGRLDRCAFLALAVLASTMARGQDVGQPEAGTEIEKKKTEDRVRYFQKAFEAQTQIGADQSARWKQLNPERYYYSYSRSSDSFRIGASLHAVDDALRSQLAIPKGQGVVVVQVARNGAAARAGIKKHDVLLTVDNQPLAKGEDLNRALKAAKGKGVAIKLLRAGGMVAVSVQPDAKAAAWTYKLTNFEEQGHRIGVEVADVDEPLRSQLRLADGKGIVVTKVLSDSPARKAGIAVYDILLEAGPLGAEKKMLASVKDLRKQVSGSAGKEIAITVLRDRTEREITVTPTARPNTLYHAMNSTGNLYRQFYGVNYPGVASLAFSPDGKLIATGGQDGTARVWDAATGQLLGNPIGTDIEKELGQVLSQLEALRKTVEKLRDRVKKGRTAGTPSAQGKKTP